MKKQYLKRTFAIKNKKIHMLLFTMSMMLLLLFCGCKSNTDEEIIITDYIDGVYTPTDHHYILTLPSMDWVIDGDEVSNNILFSYKNNAIQIKTYAENIDEMVSTLPKEQSDIEQALKNDGHMDCQIEEFKSNVSYENGAMVGEINYRYFDYETGTYVLERNIYLDDELFILSGTADSNHYNDVLYALNGFEIIKEDKEPDDEAVSIKGTEGKNVYTSYDGMYSLLLPYENWGFQVDEETNVTTLSCENKTLTISEIDSLNQNNAIAYEVPRTVFSLNKQIENLNLGKYEILEFKEQTVDAVSDIDEAGYYRTFYYLIELKSPSDGYKYYTYYEYRNEDITYKIVGKTNSTYLIDSYELLNICNSFTLQ